MTRCLVYATLAACLFAGVRAAGQEQPVFRAAGDLVRVFVTVMDDDGRLVTTLTQDQFEVRDEGKAQPITVFDNSPQPIRLVVMLDVSGSMAGNAPLLRAATEQLFTRLRPDDVVRVGSFGDDVVISPEFTRDPERLRAALADALPEKIAPDAPTPLWRGLDQAFEAFTEDEDDRRRVVLVLSDGKDSGIVGFRTRFVSQAEVIDRARDESVMVYAIGMRSRQPVRGVVRNPGDLRASLLADLPDPGLAKVAEESGGGYAEIDYGQNLGEAFARVADELHSQYLLGFEPPKRDGKVHDIEVRLKQRGLEPRARRNYVAPKD